MPVIVTCPAHPEAGELYAGDVIMHAGRHHPDEPLKQVSDNLDVRYVSQAEANGVTVTRHFRCRYCAALVVSTDPDRPPYCDEHLERAT